MTIHANDPKIAGEPAVVKELLARGADTEAKDTKGRTALDIAQRRGHQEVVDLLC